MSTSRSHLEPALHRILQQLHPYLADLVIIGGWVPYLYKWYGLAMNWQSALSFTSEVDVLAPDRLPATTRLPLREILQAANLRPMNATGTAAVWEGDVERGEKIEFFVLRQGPFIKTASLAPIHEQPGLGAIALDKLGLLGRNTGILTVPTTLPHGEILTMHVRVPQLGAYALNKCQTFNARLSSATAEGAQKRIKDLLYLRDLMAAGSDIVERIRTDIMGYLPTEQHDVDSALNELHLILRPVKRTLIFDVAQMLAARDGVDTNSARADIEGYLTDLAELLEPFQSPRVQDPDFEYHDE